MHALATIAFATLLWWASTGLIFYLDSLSPKTFPRSMAGATVALAAAFAATWLWRGEATSAGAFIGYAAAILIWGWLEMSLYMGFITGPRKHRCPDGCAGIAHFGHAVKANLWHEIAIIICAALIVVMLWSALNMTALWMFVMLWLMHLSARLNVFLGVRNVSAEFVPDHMDVLKGFLRQRAMNPLFPFSIAALALLTLWLVRGAYAAADSFTEIQFILAATLAVLGLIEHILLMLPLPIERLWRWALARRAAKTPATERPRHERLGPAKPMTRPMGA